MVKGVGFSLTASLLFGVMYYYTSLLSPLSGEQIFGWRMLLTVPVMTLFILIWGDWRQIREITQRLRREYRLWIVLPLSSALLGIQLWLFMWAPLHDRALEVSIGYFMLPLTMLLAGRCVYRAALSALLGVTHELYQAGVFSWASLLVALGYPLYFVLRRTAKTDSVGGLWFDMLLTLPVAYWFAIGGGDSALDIFDQRPVLYALIPLLGLISASALAAYVISSRYLNLSLFGLLGYVEPVLLAAVALLLGERIGPEQWFTYIPIWLAVGLLAMEGIINLLRARTFRGDI
jgi:chloramphenicol-sensitive protein RarD